MCPEKATHRYTWPGQDERFVCDVHANRVRNVSSAIGFHVQLIALA